jgi:acetylornithine deacetylase
VAVGPGSIAQAHTEDEFIEVEALEQGVAYFKKFLHSLRGDVLRPLGA